MTRAALRGAALTIALAAVQAAYSRGWGDGYNYATDRREAAPWLTFGGVA